MRGGNSMALLLTFNEFIVNVKNVNPVPAPLDRSTVLILTVPVIRRR